MINLSLKGMLNQHTLIKTPSGNTSNADNHRVYSQIVNRVEDSEMFNYLFFFILPLFCFSFQNRVFWNEKRVLGTENHQNLSFFVPNHTILARKRGFKKLTFLKKYIKNNKKNLRNQRP
ncbi:hypothetical protein FC40_GL001324 [Ligilactobacillus hayakitensis DSM 18933 = JCM 14209]|uniref:Uncharacterized protein n=1 Tax=Ligilactobacillus hayakitensis DSM 18933 = JCM 14209 TaxID=1423755 RepID=A0A0R1WQX3_9LACO|nr:hypothetical protein [Ligilactobacillus hayakitensis]KRM19805.1 hypothetical protein FC40_GL001324 [Ligilactobacillus hayakitensis DSM 18933 = JCM 14209]